MIASLASQINGLKPRFDATLEFSAGALKFRAQLDLKKSKAATITTGIGATTSTANACCEIFPPSLS